MYNLETGETMRLVLLSSASSTRHSLIIGFSHICMDGFSVQVLFRDLFHLYHHDSLLLPDPPLQYRDYTRAQHSSLTSGGWDADLQFWRQQYPDFPPELPILRVSNATARSSLTTLEQCIFTATVSPDVKRQITSLCRRLRVTSFRFYLTCFRVLLATYADVQDIAIGLADANRASDVEMSALGVLVNFLPLRFRGVADTFENELQSTKSISYAALEHSAAPLQAILDQ